MSDMVRGCCTGTSISMFAIEYGPEAGGSVLCGKGRRSRKDLAGRDRGFFALGIWPDDSPPMVLPRRALWGLSPVIRVVLRSRKDIITFNTKQRLNGTSRCNISRQIESVSVQRKMVVGGEATCSIKHISPCWLESMAIPDMLFDDNAGGTKTWSGCCGHLMLVVL